MGQQQQALHSQSSDMLVGSGALIPHAAQVTMSLKARDRLTHQTIVDGTLSHVSTTTSCGDASTSGCPSLGTV